MTATDAETYLNQLVGQLVKISQRDGGQTFLNLLSINSLGLLCQDEEGEYFIPWAAVNHLRLARQPEINRLGSPQIRPWEEGADESSI